MQARGVARVGDVEREFDAERLEEDVAAEQEHVAGCGGGALQKRHRDERDDQDGEEEPETAHATSEVGHRAEDEPGSPRARDENQGDGSQQQVAFAELRGRTYADAEDDTVGHADDLEERGEARLLPRLVEWHERRHDDGWITFEQFGYAEACERAQAEHADVEGEGQQVHDQVRGAAERHGCHERRRAMPLR